MAAELASSIRFGPEAHVCLCAWDGEAVEDGAGMDLRPAFGGGAG